MGLAERRAVKSYQENIYPGHQRAIEEAAGFAVPIEVDWASLGEEGYAHMYDEAFSAVYFQPLIAALSDIARDDLGKEALREGLKKIEIRNREGYYGDSGFSFEGGVLRIDHQPVTNIGDVDLRRDALINLIEKGL
jgi:hypothetical protein